MLHGTPFQIVKEVVDARWRKVGRRFSSADRDELLGVVLLEVVEGLPRDLLSAPPYEDEPEPEHRIRAFAAKVARGAIAELVKGTRRQKTGFVDKGITGPCTEAYADDATFGGLLGGEYERTGTAHPGVDQVALAQGDRKPKGRDREARGCHGERLWLTEQEMVNAIDERRKGVVPDPEDCVVDLWPRILVSINEMEAAA